MTFHSRIGSGIRLCMTAVDCNFISSFESNGLYFIAYHSRDSSNADLLGLLENEKSSVTGYYQIKSSFTTYVRSSLDYMKKWMTAWTLMIWRNIFEVGYGSSLRTVEVYRSTTLIRIPHFKGSTQSSVWKSSNLFELTRVDSRKTCLKSV